MVVTVSEGRTFSSGGGEKTKRNIRVLIFNVIIGRIEGLMEGSKYCYRFWREPVMKLKLC